jgi:hypothetical protein
MTKAITKPKTKTAILGVLAWPQGCFVGDDTGAVRWREGECRHVAGDLDVFYTQHGPVFTTKVNGVIEDVVLKPFELDVGKWQVTIYAALAGGAWYVAARSMLAKERAGNGE